MTKTIELTQGRIALVDDEDYDALVKFPWHAIRVRHKWYATRHQGDKKVLMHRVILGDEAGDETDHANGNGLDNRRCNIRPCTNGQNHFNRAKFPGVFTSKWKGVSWDKRNCKWEAGIQLGNRKRRLGRFDSELRAAAAYDKAAIELHGEFAKTNGV